MEIEEEKNNAELVIYESADGKVITKHINNVFNDGELDRKNNTQKMRVDGVKQLVSYYNLDVVISVGYRVKSLEGVHFRRRIVNG